MGFIKAAIDMVSTSLADQWLEVIEAAPMDSSTCFAPGVLSNNNNGKGSNKKGSRNAVSNGSKIRVRDNEFAFLLNDGKIVDFTAEPGAYTVDNSSLPSMFSGQFGDSLYEAFQRFKYGGINPSSQQVFFINLQELKGIKFGTANPVSYYDTMNGCMASVRAHGSYTLKITNPILFYQNVIPKDKVTNNEAVDFNQLNREQYLNEFVMALETSINQMSADGVNIAFIASKQTELAKYMQNALDEDWTKERGMEINKVAISINFSEATQKAFEEQQAVAMFNRPDMAATMTAKNISEGIKAAGSNSAGSAAGFMGVGMGMSMGSGMMGNFQNAYQNQPQGGGVPPVQYGANPNSGSQSGSSGGTWKCGCGAENTGNFCHNCGSPKPMPQSTANEWICGCGNKCTGKFCPNCGSPKPAPTKWICSCGAENTGKFCPNCGAKRP